MLDRENFEIVLNRVKEIYNNAENVQEYHIEIDGSINEYPTVFYRFTEILHNY